MCFLFFFLLSCVWFVDVYQPFWEGYLIVLVCVALGGCGLSGGVGATERWPPGQYSHWCVIPLWRFWLTSAEISCSIPFFFLSCYLSTTVSFLFTRKFSFPQLSLIFCWPWSVISLQTWRDYCGQKGTNATYILTNTEFPNEIKSSILFSHCCSQVVHSNCFSNNKYA